MLTAPQIETVLGDRTRVINSLEAAQQQSRAVVDARHLALCEQRVAQLLGSPTAAVDDAATEFELALIAFVEQWVIDVASMTDELVEPLRQELGDDGLQNLVHGLLVIEQRLRLGVAWRRLGLMS